MKSNFLIRAAHSVAALFFCLSFAGCNLNNSVAPIQTVERAYEVQEYRVRPLDMLRFEMYDEPANRGEYRVSREGNITLNFIGQVPVQGKTLAEIKELVEKRYHDDGYYINPQVTFTILSYAERRIYVSGYVNSAGPVLIPIEEELTLATAIDAARGVQPRGNRSNVTITRTKDGVIRTWNVDLKAIQEGREPDVPLEEGDRVHVPDSAI